MTSEDQRKLAGDLDAHVQRLRAFCPDGMLLLNALSDRLPDLRALIRAVQRFRMMVSESRLLMPARPAR